MPVSPSDLAVAHSHDTVWATDFPVWATEKTVAQTVELPLGHEKRAPQRPFSSFALQRYNKTRRKANRRRRTQNGKIRKKGKWRRVVVPCPLTWHSVLVAVPAATPFLCRRNSGCAGTNVGAAAVSICILLSIVSYFFTYFIFASRKLHRRVSRWRRVLPP